MDTASIISVIGAVLASYAGNMAIARKKAKEDEIKDAEREARQDERMKSIERKLDEHNKYAEKLSSVETSLVSMKKDIEYLKGK